MAELRLPPDTVMRPIGNIGDSGIFLGIADEGWWLLGIDVKSGRQLFGPVRLGPEEGATEFNCYVNGPPDVLCIRQGPDHGVPSTAWIVDTDSGKLSFEGPTDVRVAPADGQPQIEQVGDYVVAGVKGKGMYGVGARGELTWFVPGNGMLTAQFTRSARDTIPSALAVQGSGGVEDVVFSVTDGRVLKPVLPEGISVGRALVYPGGVAYEYTSGDDILDDRVAFVDDDGKRLSDPSLPGKLDEGSRDLPMLSTPDKRTVLAVNGRQLLELPPSLTTVDARLIGSRFYVAVDAEQSNWQQFDLDTGAAGKTCEGESLGPYFIASDGEVAVATGDRSPAEGIDLATCDVLWTLPGSLPDEAKEVWKVNTTLVQRTNDRLFSLVAPS